MSRSLRPALIVPLLLAPAAAAQPGGLITSPGPPPTFIPHEYGLAGSPTSQTDVSNPNSFVLKAPTETTQILFNWVFFRAAGDAVQYPFGNYQKSNGYNITGASNWPSGGNGNTVTYNWTDFGPPSGGVVFTAAYTLALTGGPQPLSAQLSQSLQINNPNSTPLTISLYNLMVPYPGGTTTAYTATGGLGNILATNGA
jgi:hypothetical protein